MSLCHCINTPWTDLFPLLAQNLSATSLEGKIWKGGSPSTPTPRKVNPGEVEMKHFLHGQGKNLGKQMELSPFIWAGRGKVFLHFWTVLSRPASPSHAGNKHRARPLPLSTLGLKANWGRCSEREELGGLPRKRQQERRQRREDQARREAEGQVGRGTRNASIYPS